MEIDMGIGGLEFGSDVTRIPGLVSYGPHLKILDSQERRY